MKILIVDDLAGWRDYHAQILKVIYPEAEIYAAESAHQAYGKVIENNESPFDLIITDLQMESGYEPMYAGEWLVERIKEMRNYFKTKIVIISATHNINIIAEKYGVDFIRKSTARSFPDSYREVV